MIVFRSIVQRVVLLVGLAVAIGVSVVAAIYARGFEKSILIENERAMIGLTQSAHAAFRRAMLSELPDVAHSLAVRLSLVPGIVDYRILRADGRAAFIDNVTTKAVNATLETDRYPLRSDTNASQIVPANDPILQQVLMDLQRKVYYTVQADADRLVTVLEPILSETRCSKCHADAKPVLGFIKLTKSLQGIQEDIRAAWITSVLVVIGSTLFVMASIHWVISRWVARPIQRVVYAMANATRGDLATDVTASSANEVGQMERSFQQMTTDLSQLYKSFQDEQNKLTTVILCANEGIIVTNPDGKVVLVNPAAVTILGKSVEQITRDGLMQLFDRPDWMQERFSGDGSRSPAEMLEYNGRSVSVECSTTRSGDGQMTGSAVIVRDVTEEKQLESALKRMALVDGLTGLFNRRHFDDVMLTEFLRAKRYKTQFALIMIDVDHFKKFNDVYGHDCGDRVLSAIGHVLNVATQSGQWDVKGCSAGIACRYGGEELAIVLPDVTRDDAVTIAESLRQKIEASEVQGLRVTASFGVAGFDDILQNEKNLVALADSALYAAKAAGRNCVKVGG
jgi:diguanylate cyclase (GGDEF)-like protein/PAS domain S-box-containing protein